MKKSNEKVLEKYRTISIEIAKPKLLRKLRQRFPKQLYTLEELVDLVHMVLQFDKGNIKRNENPLKIIEYGRGRCGEFAILYTALCLAYGYSARLVVDMSDHVWTEIYAHKRWIHIDPTEARINDPYMYERDWKKDLKEVYAIENGQVTKVTSRYKIEK
ncbi:MAG: transglutaminase domain-containing protein [Candidatus Bathyarchaeota archaeon]|nr:transglutaminase domain-containing protein [Candidatus Bathyarchaeota archaeon]